MKIIIAIIMSMVVSFIGISPEVWADTEKVLPEIYIKAVNPGYGTRNDGEMIEIGWSQMDGGQQTFSLAGITVRYIVTSSGNKTDLVEFPENSYMTGEFIILRLASSPEAELAAKTYTKTLGLDGTIEIVRGDEVIDRVCWTGKGECEKKFVSGSGNSLVRNLETGDFSLLPDYIPNFVPENYHEEEVGGMGEAPAPSSCKGLEFSEILSYYEESAAEQFIEFHNNTAEQILMDGCFVRYKNKNYPLTGIVKADEYAVQYLNDFHLTKNPTNKNTLEIVDGEGIVIDILEYPNGQRKGTSWAFIGYDAVGKEIWRVTYAVTAGMPNIYQEYRTCEDGKVINEETGNCVKVTEVTENVCEVGQYLNPLTGRCKKIEEESETVCKEGYEINPETGRCRKIRENDGAEYPTATETYEEQTSFVALRVILVVVAVGLVYVIFEFRHEILKLWRRVCQRFRR